MGVWGITVVKVFLFPFQEFVSIDKNSTDLSQKGWVDSSNSLCCPFYLYQLSLFDDTSFTWTVIDNIYALTIGMEKKNDDLRRYFHGKINRWDAANNLHLVEKWQEALQGQQRVNLMSLREEQPPKQEATRKVLRVSTQCPEATQVPVLLWQRTSWSQRFRS